MGKEIKGKRRGRGRKSRKAVEAETNLKWGMQVVD